MNDDDDPGGQNSKSDRERFPFGRKRNDQLGETKLDIGIGNQSAHMDGYEPDREAG